MQQWFPLLLVATLGGPGWIHAQGASADSQSARLDEVVVLGTNEGRENLPLGPNLQPEWTARRPFATTRVYVQPPWQVEAEIGWRTQWPRKGGPSHRLQQEIEIGLPYRLQLDIENADTVDHGKWDHAFNALELRCAFADWGRVPLNPTVNLEWKFNDHAADAYEVQLLLGEQFSERWHWGLNLFFEQQIGDDREREFAVAQALSYTLIDEKLSAGVEMKFASGSDKDTRSHPEYEFLIGPSFQWRPTRRTHLDVVPLFGVTHDSPRAELFVFFGFDFGPGSKEMEGVTPASLRGR